MISIVTPAEMREIDASADVPLEVLIGRAAWYVARRARAMLGGVYGRRVAVIAGPGNNGADARGAAGLLRSWGVMVTIISPDVTQIPRCDLVIDGAFGTGTNRAYRGPTLSGDVGVLAVDIPSGVDGLTGQLIGQPLVADHTVCFAALKPGLLLLPGAQMAGEVEVVDIGLDITSTRAQLLTVDDASGLLPRRLQDDHKWKRAVYVIGGSAGMYGAPMLAARGALRSGSGMAWCGLPGQPMPLVASEVVFRDLPAEHWHEPVLADARRFGALVVGCGLGRSDESGASLRALIAGTDLPTVIDGDGLRLLGLRPRLRSNVVLTPHDGEFAALAGDAPGADRFAAARSLAAATGATVLLKGPVTIVARPDGDCLATTSGDQRLATAGTGDVLAGVIGGYLAAGLAPEISASLGAWIHGEAGSNQRSFGMVASDLVDGLSEIATTLASGSPHGDSNASY